jgi:hypothetical protein
VSAQPAIEITRTAAIDIVARITEFSLYRFAG